MEYLELVENKVQFNTDMELADYKHFFHSDKNMYCITNAQGYFKFINPSFQEVLGYSKAKLIEKQLWEFIHPEDIDLFAQEMKTLKSNEATTNFVARIQDRSGNYLLFNWTLTPNLAKGKIYIIAQNLTDEKRMEENLLTANKELESFTSTVSNDLRIPLRAINGYMKILLEDYSKELGDDGIKILYSIMKNSKKMNGLLHDIHAFSKLGKKQISISEINMMALVKTVKDEELRFEDSNNRIEFNVSVLPPARGDQALIKQVWVNLINNAIKYSKNKLKATIEIGAYEENNFVVYFVKDNGVGFDMRYYDKLFGIFQRLHTQEEFDGTGISLAIIKKIIHYHNGSIWATSKLGEGATFFFSLPTIYS